MNHLLRICSKMGDRTKVVSLKLMREIFHLGLGELSVLSVSIISQSNKLTT